MTTPPDRYLDPTELSVEQLIEREQARNAGRPEPRFERVAQLTGAIYALMVVGGASGDQIRELVEEAIADTERRQEAEGR